MENSITDQLKTLFDDWKTKQENDKEYKCEKTEIAKGSFTPDGMVNEETWKQLNAENKKKVLYLLREANGNTSTLKEDGKSVDDGKFWFQQCVANGNIGNIIFTRIAEMQKIIQPDKDDKGYKEILEQVAYMNINKRGGGSTVDWKILNKYAYVYKKQIMKEICILKPDIIVCCGTYWTFVDNICGLYDREEWESHEKRNFVLKVETEIENGDKFECLIFNMYHPSARMKTENYIERFKQLWDENKCNENEGESISLRQKDVNIRKDIPTLKKEENIGEDTPILKKEYIIKVIEKLNENSEQYFDLCELISSIPQDKNL